LVYIGFCFVFVLCLVSLLFPMSLDCPFFSVSSVFSNVYLQFIIFLHNYPNVIIDVYWLTSQNWCIIYVISFYLKKLEDKKDKRICIYTIHPYKILQLTNMLWHWHWNQVLRKGNGR
jgi:hypothetical protein